jgi:hypothetical protein
VETSSVLFDNVNKDFKIKTNITCESQNLINVLFCKGPACQSFYVGQTGDKLKCRARVHRQQLLDPNIMNLNVSHHIHNCTKHMGVGEKFKILPVYKVSQENITYRKLMEKHFINMLKPNLNS